uniref:Chloroplast violaxanthin de-epoxidase 1 n=1 Tax=Karlodinium veneficum TaxID=407301 RepID=A0A1W5VMD7_KARVE|nr:chloroplast violaxanthin de-epoxidase 1 [Karlodinium veneficum]
MWTLVSFAFMRLSLHAFSVFDLCTVFCSVTLAADADQTLVKQSSGMEEQGTIFGDEVLVDETAYSFASFLLALNSESLRYLSQSPRQSRSANVHGALQDRGLFNELRRGISSLACSLALSCALNTVQPAYAENELATLAAEKSTAELVKPDCIAEKCKSEMEQCAAEKDCTKGLLCTAKCMGDTKCTVGCFARYNTPSLEKVLQCTVEDSQCIMIGTQEPRGDSASEAPKPPKALIKATPETMKGRWYKVMGFNPNYDCYDCQRNTFYTSEEAKEMLTEESVMDIGLNTATIKVEYSMDRERRGAPKTTYSAEVFEKLNFDQEPGSVRTAHTQGRMFGLTFWENWYVIGANNAREPEFRFIWYTGKTLQNRYQGAFVYAREPQIPEKALPSIYKIAREANLNPTAACPIDNTCTKFQPKFRSTVRRSSLPQESSASQESSVS